MNRPRFLEPPDGPIELPARGGFPPPAHIFEPRSVQAINAALATRRPLLVRGEPGTGKSQLAYAAAVQLGRPFVAKTVDVRTEPRELLYRVDAVARLAEAQIQGVLGSDEAAVRENLELGRFVQPDVLWWAFDWASARKQAEETCVVPIAAPALLAGMDPERGVVALIDEIDKADASIPNGLLEALGNGQFQAPGCEPVSMSDERQPLVLITTNEERSLPDAFLRRCLVLHLELPEDRSELVAWLVERGRAHDRRASASEALLQKSAELLVEDRTEARRRGLAPPGQAEYLDLLRAVTEQASGEEDQLELLIEVARFTYRKHPKESLP